jgi:TolA-binding protein
LLHEALGYFKAVVDKYPQSEWAPVALFEMGLAYRGIGYKWVPYKGKSDRRMEVTGDFERAAEAFKSVVADYPQSGLRGPALLQLGICHVDLGRYQEAEEIFKEVARVYAGSELASKADSQLRRIGK